MLKGFDLCIAIPRNRKKQPPVYRSTFLNRCLSGFYVEKIPIFKGDLLLA
jgi:hypothetical protein